MLPVAEFEECNIEPKLNWAKIDIPGLRRLLRLVFSSQVEAAERGARARQLILDKFQVRQSIGLCGTRRGHRRRCDRALDGVHGGLRSRVSQRDIRLGPPGKDAVAAR